MAGEVLVIGAIGENPVACHGPAAFSPRGGFMGLAREAAMT